MKVEFLLNGDWVSAETEPTVTLLDWLREVRGLAGTKEGCNEGDCGACSVVVQEADGTVKALNACILFLPQLSGKAVRTVEGLSDGDGMHPAQEAMVARHGSQCGFCTPGFITTMAAAHANGATDYADQLAGNLCRCTGYAPILKACEDMTGAPLPAWITRDREALAAGKESDEPALPQSSDELAAWYESHPEGTLVGGATDVGLWVNKDFRDLGPVAFLHACSDLQKIEARDGALWLGAAATMTDVLQAIRPRHPDMAEMIRRYGSTQVRNAATIGGNIANGSPIGDSPPPLIALGATLHLRKGRSRRSMLLEEFFLDYGKQDRAPGEFVEWIEIPDQPDRLKVYKLSKRFDQDISAVCGAFRITVEDGIVTDARIAFGGLAGTPKRASAVEAALRGRPWSAETVRTAKASFALDYAPLSDMRASASYRLKAAENMLERALLEDLGSATRVLEVSP